MPHEEQFVSEAIEPVVGTADTFSMARGEPGLPQRFRWRETEYRVAAVLRAWKQSGPCHHGSGEQYLRKHWFEILTDPPLVMTLYCDRQARRGRNPRGRWWLYTARPAGQPEQQHAG